MLAKKLATVLIVFGVREKLNTEKLRKNNVGVLYTLPDAHPIRGRPTMKGDERFRKGSVYDLKALKTQSKKKKNSDLEKL